MPNPTALVTCGPAYAPIDAVRRITNHSTGELGTLLCEALTRAGFSVTCLRGEMATHPAPGNARVIPFGTNQSLLETLEAIEPPAAFFHAAALCDFELAQEFPGDGKIRSDTPELHLILRPAAKILPRLRGLFPDALITGWKYEVEGTRDDALARGRHQLVAARTDACVVNGPAYGDGLGILEPDSLRHFSTRLELCASLASWARGNLHPAA